MRRFLLIFCLLFFSSRLFAQTFSQYNTGTLYDSFENPAQRAFIPDSSRQFAFNMFVPNIDANFYLTGDAQQTLKNRYFTNSYKNNNLQIGDGNHFNYLNGNSNAYAIMFKVFTSFNGDQEVGFFAQDKAEVRGVFTDESIALFNGSASFPNNSYSNVFNSRYQYQVYNEVGFTYREQVTKEFALGIKLAYVSGYYNGQVQIDQSNIVFDKAADTASLSLAGKNRKVTLSNKLPFGNPGMSVSIGTMLKTPDGFIIQGNIKDLGFIHWDRFTATYNFSGTNTIYDITSPERENNVYDAFNNTATTNKSLAHYTTPIDGHAELSLSKLYWVDDDYTVKYSPTLIASKELFYNGFTAAIVNPVTYKNYTVTLTGAYDDMKLFDLGLQFMVKSANAEFFIGSDRVPQSVNLLSSQLKSQSAINQTGAFSGGDFFIGFSMKFGDVIEHPMNASIIPMDEQKGFIGRMWDKIFNPNAGVIKDSDQ